MGDRIVVRLKSCGEYSPDFYGHWCGLRAIRVMNALVKDGKHNGMHSLMCNFIVAVMGGKLQPFSFYIYNYGESEGAADWDNYTWTLDLDSGTWTTTDPELGGRALTIQEVEEWLDGNRYSEGTVNPLKSPGRKRSESGKKPRRLFRRFRE